ncbi:hypothetical protein WN51_07692 [Melipona quadrifasciata]|uniref:Uncharacterized protein n=1 Tax=Melipona quadrifasciata TaxID=166423 RepID=A0A0M9A7W8_9HYME|nr:hypothetical protein WN51_07692 [Melipona quadrifasciata]
MPDEKFAGWHGEKTWIKVNDVCETRRGGRETLDVSCKPLSSHVRDEIDEATIIVSVILASNWIDPRIIEDDDDDDNSSVQRRHQRPREKAQYSWRSANNLHIRTSLCNKALLVDFSSSRFKRTSRGSFDRLKFDSNKWMVQKDLVHLFMTSHGEHFSMILSSFSLRRMLLDFDEIDGKLRLTGYNRNNYRVGWIKNHFKEIIFKAQWKNHSLAVDSARDVDVCGRLMSDLAKYWGIQYGCLIPNRAQERREQLVPNRYVTCPAGVFSENRIPACNQQTEIADGNRNFTRLERAGSQS